MAIFDLHFRFDGHSAREDGPLEKENPEKKVLTPKNRGITTLHWGQGLDWVGDYSAGAFGWHARVFYEKNPVEGRVNRMKYLHRRS